MLAMVEVIMGQVENTPTNQRVVNIYLPTAQYRYIDLTSVSAMNLIDFKFYWSDWLGNIYPIFLNENGAVSIKVLFQKKKLNLPK